MSRFGDELARVLEAAGVSARETAALRLEGNRLQAAGALAEQIGDVNSGTLNPDVFARSRIFSKYPGMGGSVHVGVAVTIPTATPTLIHFDGSTLDTDKFVDLTAHDDRMTVPQGAGGLYLIWGKAEWAANAGGSWRYAIIKNYAETYGTWSYTGATASYTTTGIVTPALWELSAGEYIYMKLEHNAGVDIVASPQMWIMRVV